MNGIFWIESNPPVPLAIVLCPHGGDGLQDELLAMKRGGVNTVVSLLEKKEALMLGVGKEGSFAESIGLRFLSHPIPDTQVPPKPAAFDAFVEDLASRLRAGEHLGIHCRGSIGRSTVTAACALIHLGWKPEDALAAIQAARGCCVPDTQKQEDWILHYQPKP